MARKMSRCLPLYQVDAFTDRPFAGNPAAVVPLKSWLTDTLMQQIAAENNLSETAFFVPVAGATGGDKSPEYQLRWFTPRSEIGLCGHATLASGYVVMSALQPAAERIVFHSKSGPLTVQRLAARRGKPPMLQLDFPARPGKRVDARLARRVASAIGSRPDEVWQAAKLMAVLPSSRAVHAVRPDFAAIEALPAEGLIVTAPAAPGERPADFVSRYFAPHFGVNEDPVTGSAHCTLVPYWAERLGKTQLQARQVSARGGDLLCGLAGDRVTMAGHAAPFMTGTIHVR